MTDGTNTGSLSNQVAKTVKLSWSGSLDVNTVGTTAAVASAAGQAIHVLAYNCGDLVSTFVGKSRVRFLG